MNDEGPRINGGIGFAITRPFLEVVSAEDADFSLIDERKLGLSNSEKSRLIACLKIAKEKYALKHSISVSISGDSITHHGFGRGTAIRLACLESLMLLNGRVASNDDLIRLSGRGGTSGIGIHTYFSGGLVIDLGRKHVGGLHIPSTQVDGAFSKPLLLQQTQMPDWDIGICIPSQIDVLSEEDEKAFFRKVCPILESEAHRAVYYSITGVYAAVRENDKPVFEASIRMLQECAWKRAEREEHGQPLVNLERELYKAGANAVGMSSLGPSLFFLADDIDAVIAKATEALPSCKFIKTKPANSGRVIKHA